MKNLLALFLISNCFLSAAQSSERSSLFKGWTISNIGVRYQSTDQYLPDLNYQEIIAFANNQDASEVDMSGFAANGIHEFFSESVGVYVGVSRPFGNHFSHYVEAGADYHVASEFYVEYGNGSFFDPDYQSYGWCILQDGLNFHLKYGLSYDWRFVQARIGPGLTYGTSINNELLLLTTDFNTTATFPSDQNFGQVASTRTWVGYLDAQFAFNVFKNFSAVVQGKWGTGTVGGLDERVKRSSVFGAGIEYQFK